MNDVDTFLNLVRDELALQVGADGIDRRLTDLEGWDSVHLLRLVGAVEARTGRRVSIPHLLRARTLREVHAAVSAP